MELVLLILAFVLLASGILGAIIPVLPGPPLSFAGLLVLQWSGRGEFTFVFLLVWALIAAVVTIIDYLLPSFMAKRFGGSRAASIGSFLGLLAGIFFFPPLGFIIGPFLGALTGELIIRRAQNTQAFKAAFGAFLAFFVGSGAKMIVCTLMLFYAIRAI